MNQKKNSPIKEKGFGFFARIKAFFNIKIDLNKHQLFTIFGLFWVILGWFGLVLSLLGIFYTAFFVGYIFLGIAFFVYIFSFNKGKIEIQPHFFWLFILSLVSVFVFSFYTTPTIFSGRDQGSFSEAAIQLSQNHRLTFSFDGQKEFFQIYGPGKALNFPGFIYTAKGELTTQFPLGYITWLSIFYSMSGMNGFMVANSISFIIFIFSFYLVARYYLRPSSSIVATILILTSFAFSWFFKFTLSENLGLMLTWFGTYTFVTFTRTKKRLYLLASLSAFTMLVFSRIEAISFLAIIIFILLVKYKDWKYLLFVVIGKKILLFIGGFILLYFFNLAFDTQSYISLLKNILHPFISLGSGIKNYSSSPVSFFDTSIYTVKILFSYGIFSYIALGLIGFFYLWRNKKFESIIPFLIVLPSFIYIIYPSISSDHPWMLRRFVFSVLPISIFYTVYFFDCFFKRRSYFHLFCLVLLLTNLAVFIPYLKISPNKGLLKQVEEISNNFKSTDLILVDRDATGDGWSMMTGPMNSQFGLQAAYFFNSKDLNKIDRKKFSSIYFIIPDEKIEFYRQEGLLKKIIPIKNYSLEIRNLDIQIGTKKNLYASPIKLPEEKERIVSGKIYQLKY
ncbi:MAG: hypothetical protein ACD_15C00104G0018 [uncultured bacterium]|nr:MAG: hypothetical protein ACD_15C00104G0018 [uncultured bacterium]HCU70383.1 hypothetical protein [Candidatus Moranbacteria bacterium]